MHTGKLIRMDSTTKVSITESDYFNSQCIKSPSTNGELGIEQGKKEESHIVSGRYIVDIASGSVCSVTKMRNDEIVTTIAEIHKHIRDAIYIPKDVAKNIYMAAKEVYLRHLMQ